MKINLWLDDYRKPPTFEQCGLVWSWAKTADEAISMMKTGEVVYASLDHDLAEEHYYAYESSSDREDKGFKEKTGYDVLLWMEENAVWPEHGVRIHTMNTARKPVMLQAVRAAYGRTFQEQYAGTHKV